MNVREFYSCALEQGTLEQGSVSRNGSGSRLNMVSSCSPQKYSALGQNDDEVLPGVTSCCQVTSRSDQYNNVAIEEKLRIPQVQNVLATRGSRTPSPFRTIFKGMAKGAEGRRLLVVGLCR